MRVCRACYATHSTCSDVGCCCRLLLMKDVKTLISLVRKERPPDVSKRAHEREIKYYKEELRKISVHECDNPFFDLDYGEHPRGLLGALPPDLMHVFEGGIIPRVMEIFVGSMTLSVRAEVDDFIEKHFANIKSGSRSDFPRMNFTNGATSITLLNSCLLYTSPSPRDS